MDQLNESEIDLNEHEHFLKANSHRSWSDLIVRMARPSDQSEFDPRRINVTVHNICAVIKLNIKSEQSPLYNFGKHT